MKTKKKQKKTVTYIKPQESTINILSSYYIDTNNKLNKMQNWKRKPSRKQVINAWKKITHQYALIIEKELEKAQTIKLSFDSPKSWEKLSKKLEGTATK